MKYYTNSSHPPEAGDASAPLPCQSPPHRRAAATLQQSSLPPRTAPPLLFPSGRLFSSRALPTCMWAGFGRSLYMCQHGHQSHTTRWRAHLRDPVMPSPLHLHSVPSRHSALTCSIRTERQNKATFLLPQKGRVSADAPSSLIYAEEHHGAIYQKGREFPEIF